MAPDSKSAFGQEAVQRSGAQLLAPAGEAAHSHMAHPCNAHATPMWPCALQPAWDTPLTGPTSHMKSRNPGSQGPPAPAPTLPAWVPLSNAPPALEASGQAGGLRAASGCGGQQQPAAGPGGFVGLNALTEAKG
ncbi:hypothetical protein HaLaN_18397 [Haematococcus lacustris]|uniref:Uncharacterized protein n=1 Tax=Haematococcus lacustris TaxID=44745 RepID=A0A699ZQX8_HAELA|nr:hypothetical protein HaLaN_18397 [Haematococcus lacustris]